MPETNADSSNDPETQARADALAAQVATARSLAADALKTYERIEKDFADVKGAEEPVRTARTVIEALNSSPSVVGPLSLIPMGVLVVCFWGAIGFGIAAIFAPRVQALWSEYWPWVPGVFVISGILLYFARRVERWLGRASEETSRKFATMFAIPTIALAIVALFALGASRVALASQVMVILLTALLPATMYYLFLATRRPSILNEFIGNLSRLGLLSIRGEHTAQTQSVDSSRAPESREERCARVESYFQRFEAIYGTLRFESSGPPVTRRDLVERLTEAVSGSPSSGRLPQPVIHIGDIFNANLIIPIGLVTILSALGWLLVLQPDLGALERGAQGAATLVPKPTTVNFAFLGAYFFGVQMLFRRFVRRDLGPNAYLAFANRIILALIGVWVLAAVYPAPTQEASSIASTASAATTPVDAAAGTTATDAGKPADARNEKNVNAVEAEVKPQSEPSTIDKGITMIGAVTDKAKASLADNADDVLLALAFLIGVFPRVLWQFLSAAVTKLPFIKLILPSTEAKQPLSDLDGLTIWHETRLEEEDVENVPNMASVDVVELMLHTQIPAERLVSWIDQAILLTSLGVSTDGGTNPRDKLRKCGFRSATQVVGAHEHKVAEKALKDALGEDGAAPLVFALQKEVNFDLVRAWREV